MHACRLTHSLSPPPCHIGCFAAHFSNHERLGAVTATSPVRRLEFQGLRCTAPRDKPMPQCTACKVQTKRSNPTLCTRPKANLNSLPSPCPPSASTSTGRQNGRALRGVPQGRAQWCTSTAATPCRCVGACHWGDWGRGWWGDRWGAGQEEVREGWSGEGGAHLQCSATGGASRAGPCAIKPPAGVRPPRG